MRQTLIVALGALCACMERGQTVAPGQPYTRSPAELSKIVGAQAYESRLAIAGVAIFDSTLYVTTNVGLFEVRGGRIQQLDQWRRDDNVLSGPWRDRSQGHLWVLRVHEQYFMVRDRTGWSRVDRPTPPKGYLSRGDVLEGVNFASDSADLWLVSAGSVWHRSDSATWVIQPRPPAGEFDATIGFAKLDGSELQIVTSGSCGYLPCTNQGFWLTGGKWGRPVRLKVHEIADQVAASNAVFVRGDSGEVLRVDRDSAVVIPAPGRCEAIGRTSDGKLIASFRKAGIFVLESKWRKLFDAPAPQVDGEQWAFIAEQDGVVAYATTTVPVIKPGPKTEFTLSGAVGLWVSEGTRLVRTELPR